MFCFIKASCNEDALLITKFHLLNSFGAQQFNYASIFIPATTTSTFLVGPLLLPQLIFKTKSDKREKFTNNNKIIFLRNCRIKSIAVCFNQNGYYYWPLDLVSNLKSQLIFFFVNLASCLMMDNIDLIFLYLRNFLQFFSSNNENVKSQGCGFLQKFFFS